MKNPTTDTGLCGTPRGYNIHRRRNETHCQPCRNAYNKTRYTEKERRPSADEIAEEIRHMLSLNQGYGYIIRAIGYQGREASLEKYLGSYGHRPLYARLMGKMDAAA